MSQILVKPELLKQAKASEIIRTFTFRQTRYMQTDDKGRYCVFGGLFKYFGMTDEEMNGRILGIDPIRNHILIKKVHSLFNHNDHIPGKIVEMNNSGSTFGDIADYLESIGL